MEWSLTAWRVDDEGKQYNVLTKYHLTIYGLFEAFLEASILGATTIVTKRSKRLDT